MAGDGKALPMLPEAWFKLASEAMQQAARDAYSAPGAMEAQTWRKGDMQAIMGALTHGIKLAIDASQEQARTRSTLAAEAAVRFLAGEMKAREQRLRDDLHQPAERSGGGEDFAEVMPEHEWDGTRLRFEEAPGVWGPWVDLQGKSGRNGQGGGVIERTQVIVLGGGPGPLVIGGGGAADNVDLSIGGGGASSNFPLVFDGGGVAGW